MKICLLNIDQFTQKIKCSYLGIVINSVSVA